MQQQQKPYLYLFFKKTNCFLYKNNKKATLFKAEDNIAKYGLF